MFWRGSICPARSRASTSPMPPHSPSIFQVEPSGKRRAHRLAFAHDLPPATAHFCRHIFFFFASATTLHDRKSHPEASTDFIRKDKFPGELWYTRSHAPRRNRTTTQRIDRTSATGARDQSARQSALPQGVGSAHPNLDADPGHPPPGALEDRDVADRRRRQISGDVGAKAYFLSCRCPPKFGA